MNTCYTAVPCWCWLLHACVCSCYVSSFSVQYALFIIQNEAQHVSMNINCQLTCPPCLCWVSQFSIMSTQPLPLWPPPQSEARQLPSSATLPAPQQQQQVVLIPSQWPLQLGFLLCSHLGWRDLLSLQQCTAGWRSEIAAEPLIWVTQLLKQHPRHMLPRCELPPPFHAPWFCPYAC